MPTHAKTPCRRPLPSLLPVVIISTDPARGCGEIGRRARFRFWYLHRFESSILCIRTTQIINYLDEISTA